jgi:hypothetical protein
LLLKRNFSGGALSEKFNQNTTCKLALERYLKIALCFLSSFSFAGENVSAAA